MPPAREFIIRSITRSDLEALREFTDLAIGKGYYSLSELEDVLERSRGVEAGGSPQICSLLLKSGEDIVGVRFTYAPGRWDHGKGRGLNPMKWPHGLRDTAYFQSLFLADEIRGRGWGRKLSEASIEILKKIGARGVVCHAWKESPFNSSLKYLEKMGFEKIAEHPLYWSHVNYDCTRCLRPPCRCTALEMYYEIQEAR